MKTAACVIASALTLAACNKGPEVDLKNASAGEVAEKVRDATGGESFVEPGKWQTKITVLNVDIPGMPPQMAQQMKLSMAKMQEHSYETCLTQADVKRPKEDFFAGRHNECRYDHFTMSGGKIDAVMHCAGKPSGAMTMAINGTYSRDSYEVTMAMDVSGDRQGGMKMRSHSESHRIGQCTADEIKAKTDASRK
jgi:hypothetical protein